ncbi:MAG: CsiV family protein [Glaciecola sp.]|nr:CsiV family protein [Glaciecola sp.]MDG1468601.1 CsiV family protein [Glaciecola sp.]
MSKALRVTHKPSTKMIYLLIISMLFCFSSITRAQEDTDWWFDVEILIFKHNNAENTVTEQFDTVVDKPFSPRISNVFLPFYVVDTSWIEQALPECPNLIDVLADKFTDTVTNTVTMSVANDSSNQHIGRMDCAYTLTLSDLVERNQPVDHYQAYPTLPIHYEGIIFPRSEYAHMLPQSELQLVSLYKDVNWDKSYTPLLHTVWRQPVNIGDENAFSIPILAGKNLTYQAPTPQLLAQASLDQANTLMGTDNLSNESLINESPISESSINIVQKIKLGLDGTVPLYPDQLKETQDKAMIDTTSVFEFEGLVTIYIKYINRVPYLHIDSHALFNTSRVSDPLTIIPHTFKQRRRIISNQVHYFDHPYFGMVIELRRYKRPALAALESSIESSTN